MRTAVTPEGPTRVRIQVEASAEELVPAVERAVRRLAREVKVPGFRPGRAPRPVLESRLGSGEIRAAALREALPDLYRRALEETGVEPLAPPEIEVKDYDETTGLRFEAVVEVRPEIRLPDLSTLSVERPSVAVTDEEVTEQLERLRDRFATLQPVARPGRRGDFALIDLKGYVHDREVPEATATDLLYEIGSERFVPALDAELEGARQGDILKFNATLPPTFPGEHAGKEIAFQVLVKDVREKVLPALDDEFARTASEFETLEELRADLRARIGEAKRLAADAEVRRRLLERLVAEAGVAVPDALLEEELSYRAARFGDTLRRAGLTLEQYAEGTGRSDAEIEADLRAQAERNVAAQLVLEEIGRREGLAASEEEVAEELERHARTLGRDPAELRARLASAGRLGALAADIIRRKALDLVVERADITDADAPPGSASPAER
jgi:trigger factor